MAADIPVRDSIREIDGDTWVIASHHLLLTRQDQPATSSPSWGDGHGLFVVLSEYPESDPPAGSRPLPETGSGPNKVYDAGDAHVVFKAGEAYIKIQIISQPDATREHVTLAFLQEKGPLGFDIPRVYHHSESDDTRSYCLITSELQGQTLHVAWPGMDEDKKQYFVNLVATKVCQQLSEWKGDCISGVAGRELWDQSLAEREIMTPEALVRNCMEIGMDCSPRSFCFYHSDLGPGNIIVMGDQSDRVGVQDWETASFVPLEWIRTKFRMRGGFDYEDDDFDFDIQVNWRRRVQHRLGAIGFLG